MAKQSQRNPSQDLPTAQAGRSGAGPVAEPDRPKADDHPPQPVTQTDEVPPEQTRGALDNLAGSGQPPSSQPLALMDGDRPQHQRVATSIDVTDDAGRLAVFAAIELEDRKAKDVVNVHLDVVHWVMYDYYSPNPESGEIEHHVRTVLVLADGTSVGSGSPSVAKSWGHLLCLLPPPPWTPPRRVRVVARRSNNGRDYHVIDPR